MTALKSIRAFCLDCNGSAHEVKLCPCTECALYPFRLGKSPNHKPREMTEEQRKASSERMKRMHEKKAQE
jgi:hypothetical protein